MAEEVLPKNILMIGPTGVGKTEIARRLARLAGCPFVKVEASKYTEVGYVGRDVESMIRDLVETAIDMVREEKLDEVAERAGGAALRLVTILAVVIASAIANAMAAQAAVSRILFAMARDGKLPRVLARVHPRFRTPYVSTLAVAVVSLLVGLLFAERVDDLTRIVNFGALSGFVLLHLSVISHYFYRRRSGDWLRHIVFPLTGLAIIIYVLYEMDGTAKVLGACWIAIGALYYLVLALRAKKAVALEI